MRSTRAYLVISGLVVGVALMTAFLGQATAAESPVHLVTGNDYTPFSDQSLPDGGLITDIVVTALRRQGVQVDLQWMPWKQGYARTASAAIDATFPYQRTVERGAEMLYSAPLYEVTQRVFWNHRTGRPANDPADLTGQTLCVPLGYTPPREFLDMIQAGAIGRDQPPDMTECFRRLKAGTVDYVATHLFQGNALMAAVGMPLRDAGISRFALHESTLHLIVSRSHPHGPALIATFDAGLAALRADGTYDDLVRKHLGEGGM